MCSWYDPVYALGKCNRVTADKNTKTRLVFYLISLTKNTCRNISPEICGTVSTMIECYSLTSHLGVVAERARFVDPVVLQQLLVPGATVQRVPEP